MDVVIVVRPLTAAEEVHAYWATWVFLAVLAALTAGVLKLWAGNFKTWRKLLPAPRPEGWEPVERFAPMVPGTRGLELGTTWRSVHDPGALWSLSWQEPDQLIATRRPEFPPPPAGAYTMRLGAGLDAEYRGATILLTCVSEPMAREGLWKATRWREGPGGADQLLAFLIDAGAVPSVPALHLLVPDAVRGGPRPDDAGREP